MALSANEIDAKFGTTTTYAQGNAAAFNSGAPKNVPAPKSNFFGDLGHSLVNLPAQAAGLVFHATVDPFAHLIGNAGNAMNADSNAATQENFAKQQNQQSKQAKIDFTAGHITRQQYIDKVHVISQAAQGQSQAVQGQQVKSIAQMAPDALSAIATTATLGAGTLVKGAAEAGAKAIGTKIAGQTGAKVLGTVGRGVDGLIGSGKGLVGKNVITQLPGKMVRNAVFTQPTVQAPVQMTSDLKKGDFIGAAGNAALLAAPGALSLAGKGIKALNLGEKAFGVSSTLSDAFGHAKVAQWAKTATPEQLATLKNMELLTENQKTSNPGQFLADHLSSIGVNPKTATLEDVVNHHDQYLAANDVLKTATAKNAQQVADALSHNKSARAEAKAINTDNATKALQENAQSKPLNLRQQQEYEQAFGAKYPEPKVSAPVATVKPNIIKTNAMPDNLVVTHDYSKAIPASVDALKQLGESPTLQEKVAAIEKTLNNLGVKNETVRTQIGAALQRVEGTGEQMASQAGKIIQKSMYTHPDLKLPEGFAATGGPKDAAHIPTAAEVADAGGINVGKAPNRVIGAVATGMKKVGLGLNDYNPAQIGMAEKTFATSIDKMGNPTLEGKSTYDALSALAEHQKLTDIRQLRIGDIAQKLDVTNSEARTILKATKNMYSEVGVDIRGFAGKLTDANLKYNPLATPYARIQSKLRYSDNPSFQVQQKIEAATLGQVVTGGHAPIGDVSQTVGLMRKEGFIPGYDKGSIGEAMLENKGMTNVTTHLTRSEENSIGRVLQATAIKNGTTVADELKNETTRRIMRAIVQNPKQGFLSSNFARAMNIAVFPLSYNIKVTTLAAKALAGQPKAVQFGIAKSIADFSSWTKTDAGVKWKSDNSELIGLINYFTPVNSIAQIYNGLHDGDVQQLGLIGGLPFGVITRVLEGQGIKPPSGNPYINPKTGALVPDKIPATDKARLQQGLSDILNTMFTFPGRQAGLGSKKDLLNTLTGNILKPSSKDVTPRDRSGSLTPEQLNTQRVLGTKPSTAIASPQSVAVNPASLRLFKQTPPPLSEGIPKAKTLRAPRAKIYAKRPGQPF